MPIRLEKALLERLLDLPYPAFAEVVCAWLEKSGYMQAHVLKNATWGARNGDGGIDITATTDNSLIRVPIVAQAKQYSRPVQKRYVDELRGAMIRTGAQIGVIVTTSMFAKAARNAAAQGNHVPVVLVDGHELTALMAEHLIGVVELNGSRVVDEQYFNNLRQYVRRLRHNDKLDQSAGSDPNPFLTVTLWYGKRTASSRSRRCGS